MGLAVVGSVAALEAEQLSWVAGEAPRTHWVYTAKPRYRSEDAPCEIERVEGDRAELVFAQPQWALTPGQSVVVYGGADATQVLAQATIGLDRSPFET